MNRASGFIETESLTVCAGTKLLLKNVSVQIEPRQVFAIIGPSGAGKSTFLRCLNRLIDLDASLRIEGDVRIDGESIYGPSVNVDTLRSRVGILFQQPVVFPVSILNNVLFAVRRLGRHPKAEWSKIAENALRESALWDEVKHRLNDPAAKLSVGQQQRLCLARTLAVNPEILLMDEPTSALDPGSTEMIESLILRLKTQRTVVIVTHNLTQANRISDHVARVDCVNGYGEIKAIGTTKEILP